MSGDGPPLQDRLAGIDLARVAGRLLASPPDHPERPVPDWAPPRPFERPPVPAAVLIALVLRPEGAGVLYTERSAQLRTHSGQVSFPGGKIDPTDADAADAALREAEEEVGVSRADSRVLGFMPTYFTGTNYLITPVVAVIEPRAPFVPNPREVTAVFEVPLARIMRPETYGRLRITREGRAHESWRIDHEGRRIWGITANLTRRFFELAAEDGP